MENPHRTDINENIPCWKFSECATDTPPKIKGTIENFLKKKLFNPFEFGHYNLRNTGIYRLSGWAFDFRGYLKEYVFKTNYSIEEGYFINKTNIRKVVCTRVLWIREI